jgi:hypothetical protein
MSTEKPARIYLSSLPDGSLCINQSGGLFADGDSLSSLRKSRPAAFRELVARLNADNSEKLNGEFSKIRKAHCAPGM